MHIHYSNSFSWLIVAVRALINRYPKRIVNGRLKSLFADTMKELGDLIRAVAPEGVGRRMAGDDALRGQDDLCLSWLAPSPAVHPAWTQVGVGRPRHSTLFVLDQLGRLKVARQGVVREPWVS